MLALAVRRAALALPSSVAACAPAMRQNRLFRTAPTLLAGQGSHIHRDTPENNESIPFEFTKESEAEIEKYLSRYPDTPQGRQSAIMPALWVVQQQLDRAHKTIKAETKYEGAFAFDKPQGSGGWVPLKAMHAIADKLGCSRMAVYEVATFFTMYNRNLQGKFHIQLCATTPCMVCGAYDILAAIEKHLGIKCGETTSDGMFTLTEVECLGACVNAPMIQVNDYFFEDLTPENVIPLLDNLKAGKPVKIGPQNDRVHSLGPQGRTSLTSPPAGPYCRDLSKIADPA